MENARTFVLEPWDQRGLLCKRAEGKDRLLWKETGGLNNPFAMGQN